MKSKRVDVCLLGATLLTALACSGCSGESTSTAMASLDTTSTGSDGSPSASSTSGGTTAGMGTATGASDSTTQAGPITSSNSMGAGGSTSGSGSATTGGMPALGPDGFPTTCSEVVDLGLSATQRTSVQIAISSDDQPFIFGEPNEFPSGGTILPTNFRFYLSQFALYQGDQRFAAAPVDAQGNPAAFGVQFVNAEDESSLRFELLAAPADYDGISFLIGLSYGCNQTVQALAPPLDEASQMKWPHALGFLFLRFEGNLDDLAPPGTPNQIHMGAAAGENGHAPEFRISIPPGSAAAGLQLELAFDAILQGAATETDLSDFVLPPPAPPVVGEEILAGERLRRAAPSLGLFSLSQGS